MERFRGGRTGILELVRFVDDEQTEIERGEEGDVRSR